MSRVDGLWDVTCAALAGHLFDPVVGFVVPLISHFCAFDNSEFVDQWFSPIVAIAGALPTPYPEPFVQCVAAFVRQPHLQEYDLVSVGCLATSRSALVVCHMRVGG